MRRLSWPVYGRMLLRLFVKRTLQFPLWILIAIVALTMTMPNVDATSIAVEKKVVGTQKADTIRGTAKFEHIVGKGGNDCLYGGRGDDALDGGKGKDRLYGGKGNDAIFAKDGQQDRIDCGKGKQDAIWMPYDKGKDKVRGCEKKVNRDGTITDFKDKKNSV